MARVAALVPDRQAQAEGQRGEKRVAQPEERKFLGFSISNDGSERHIAPKALARFQARIRNMTRRTGPLSNAHVATQHCPTD
jgi:hypothetical protein